MAKKKEQAFMLSLPALVKGKDALEKEFREKTQIFHMSSEEVTFGLNRKVLVGSKLVIWLDIPRTLLLEKPLTLSVSGIVQLIKGEKQLKKKQLISIQLDKKYQIESGLQ